MPPKIFVSGMGAVTCAGIGVDRLWTAARDGQSYIHEGLGLLSNESLQELNKNCTLESRAALMGVAALSECLAQAAWNDLGEDVRVALLSVTEGEDKPLKYPTMFHSSSVAVN